MGRVLRAAGLAGAAMLLASCGFAVTSQEGPEPSSEGLVGTMWLLDDLRGTPPVEGTAVTAVFDRSDTLSGSSGCNRYTGSYALDGTSLEVGPELASTMMACIDNAVMELEASFLAALPEAKGAVVDGDQLTLSDADGNPVATFTAQSQDLAGTEWRITAFNDNSGAVVSALAETEPSVTFVQDGTINGTGGCNRFTGSYTTGQGILTVGSISSTKVKCSEIDGVGTQEKRIKTALESAATYLVEGDTLELRTIDGEIAVQLTRA